jgi:Fur family transcriptional regulator, ferric uptake regulator
LDSEFTIRNSEFGIHNSQFGIRNSEFQSSILPNYRSCSRSRSRSRSPYYLRGMARNTEAKLNIIELISSSEVALSHADIQQSLNGLCDRVTIYRVLDRLVDEGKIHKVLDTDGVAKYASCHACEAGHHHDAHAHFSCVVCKSVTCLEKITPQITLPRKYQVQDIHLTISGICPECK